MKSRALDVVTVTPNPAIDWTITIPDFTPGKVNRVTNQRANAGGKGVNVASLLADYGKRVGVSGFLGNANSEAFDAVFKDKDLWDAFVRIDGNTRTGIKVVDPAKGETTDINFPGAAPTGGDVRQLIDRIGSLAEEATPWFVLAGSLPPGVEIDFYGSLIRQLKSAGCGVVVDTSGDAFAHAVVAGPDIIKPNIHELEALVEGRLPTVEAIRAAAREIVADGISLVVVSMGAEGTLFVTDDEVVLARPPWVEIGSTVGAGDAMVAGIVAGHLEQRPLADIARLSTAFSLHVLARGNALRDSINKWSGAVSVEQL